MNKEGSKRNGKEHNEGHTVTTHGLYGMLHVGNVVLSRRLRPCDQGINLRCAAILCEGANQTLRSILVRGPQPKIVREGCSVQSSSPSDRRPKSPCPIDQESMFAS